MASRKQLAAINPAPGERRRFVCPGPAETRTPTPIFGTSLDRPHSAGSVCRLFLWAQKRLAKCRTPHPHELSAQTEMLDMSQGNMMATAFWTSLNVTADEVLGCD